MSKTEVKAAVQSQMIAAMKSGDKNRTQVLRMVLSEIKRVEADKPDADPQAAVAAYAKTLRKTMAEMEKLNQPERVAQLKTEITIVDEFMPQQMDDAALEKVVAEALAPLGPLTKKDQGKAIGAVMKAVTASGLAADAGKVRSLVESKIAP
jgi:uncharacterized protein